MSLFGSPGSRRSLLVLALALDVGAFGCAGNPAPKSPSASAPPHTMTEPPLDHVAPIPAASIALEPPPAATTILGAQLDRLLSPPELQQASWAVAVQSMASDEVLYRRNAAKFMVPASNMKLVTLAAAAERLGWEYRYETRLETAATIEHGKLLGDLIVVGDGDPTISGPHSTPAPLFDAWAAELSAAGIESIAGRVIGDDNAFDDRGLGAGWSWDYLAQGFAAPVGALQYNANAVDITFRAGPRPGTPVVIEGHPPAVGPTLLNYLVTGEANSETAIEFRRPVGGQTLELRGSVPAGAPDFIKSASVENPTQFYVSALRATLIAHGISVAGEALDIDDVTDRFGAAAVPPPSSDRHVLARHSSPPLREMAVLMMKVSQNVYADSLLKTMGAVNGNGTVEGGRHAVREVLQGWGIPPEGYILADGSGLSRYNYVTADLLVKILRQMHDPRHAANFEATLPIAGVDGTLAERMKRMPLQGNVHAKTGSLANVRALSGYVTTRDGEQLAFSILANHFNVPNTSVDAVTDAIVDRLASFSRGAATE
jgi:D-alanyl-D-alanine carboxypeptidase/D-alanyl-D-alanine-endopeptidase (penicillin-binding protein 4)